MNYTTLDDQALIALIVQQRAEALQTLYHRYGRLVFSLTFNVVNDQHTAEELTLDVFMRIWEKADTYQPERALARSWLLGIARYRAIDWLRQQKSAREYIHLRLAELPTDSIPVHNNFEDNILDRDVMRLALAQLPSEQQEALVLAYYWGYTHSQMAEYLDQPLGTVKTRVRLGMQKLRQILTDSEA